MPDVYVADCEMQKFCNSMPCEGHRTRLRFIEAKHPTRSFYLMKREELEKWFNCLSREVVFSKQKIVVAAYYMGNP